MKSNRSLKSEVVIVAAGGVCGGVAAMLAMVGHKGAIEGVLSLLYALLMSAMYYIWFSLTGWRKLLGYLLLCGITGYLLGLAEVAFLT